MLMRRTPKGAKITAVILSMDENNVKASSFLSAAKLKIIYNIINEINV